MFNYFNTSALTHSLHDSLVSTALAEAPASAAAAAVPEDSLFLLRHPPGGRRAGRLRGRPEDGGEEAGAPATHAVEATASSCSLPVDDMTGWWHACTGRRQEGTEDKENKLLHFRFPKDFLKKCARKSLCCPFFSFLVGLLALFPPFRVSRPGASFSFQAVARPTGRPARAREPRGCVIQSTLAADKRKQAGNKVTRKGTDWAKIVTFLFQNRCF